MPEQPRERATKISVATDLRPDGCLRPLGREPQSITKTSQFAGSVLAAPC